MTADSPSPDAVCTCLVPIVVIKAELRPLDPDQLLGLGNALEPRSSAR
jgi:hypothetical protein